MFKVVSTLFVAIVFGLLSSCSSRPSDVQSVDQLPAIYPDYVGVTIPADIAPLNFSMADDDVTAIDVEVSGSKGGSMHVNGRWADFDIDEWHRLARQNRGGSLSLTVCARKNGQWTRYRSFTVYVSPHALGEWGVTYRRIAPSYALYSHMGLYERCLSTFEERPLIENTQSPGMCINCHTANRTNPDQYVFHVRGQHGATVVHRSGRDELLRAKNETLGGSMVYPYWHPGGRYCAFSTNATSQMFHTAQNKRIEVYDSSSDVFVYDTQSHTILSDTLIMRKYWAENCPAFSPDGRWLYFVTARRQVYPTDYDKECYSLCRVSFDEQTGKLGQQVDTLVRSQSLAGKSLSWPRPSYDGRYLMFTLADYGYFTVWHPESDLWLLDLQSGESRPLNEVNTQRAESFHNWSTNSRWFLFTSRRDDGLYTRLYISSFDPATGQAGKPFLLPQRNPRKYYRELLYSYNTPDFSARAIRPDAREMGRKIDDEHRIGTKTLQKNKQ